MKRKMRDYQTFIFDMDGTLIEGDTVLPGTLDLLHDLRNHKKQILLATNCPRWSKQSLAERLQQLGIAVFPHEIVTPVDALAAYFENEFSSVRLLGLIAQPVAEELRSLGFHLVEPEKWQGKQVSHVLLGMYEELTYKHLCLALKALDQGACLMAMNPDRFGPVPGGRIPDSGALAACLELSSGQKAVFLGKPSPWIQRAIKDRLQSSVDACLLIGDSPYTDIQIGETLGMDTVLLRSGIGSFVEDDLGVKPTYRFPTLDAFYHEYRCLACV